MDLLKKYSKLVEKLSKLEGVIAVYVFGGYAKNKITNKSDLDICFIIDKDNKKLEEELISNANQELDISIYHNLKLSFQFEILKTGKILYILNNNKYKIIRRNILLKYKEESWVYKMIYQRRYGVEV